VLLWNRHAIPATKTLPCTKSIWSCMRPTRPGSALLMACLLTGASSAIYWTFARNFLTDDKGASDSEAVLFWIVMGVTGILGGCAGRIIERIELSWSYRMGNETVPTECLHRDKSCLSCTRRGAISRIIYGGIHH
jgi:predicted MFS family arabinose efflux permease